MDDYRYMGFPEIIERATNATYLLETGGFILLMILVFIESGVFFGFIIPGDTLLFTAGLLCAIGTLEVSLPVLCSATVLSAFSGSLFGYIFGQNFSGKVDTMKDTLFLKKKHMMLAREFLEKYGGYTLILGRFVPVVRTFGPIVAGMVKLNSKKFYLFSLAGALIWVISLTLAGYYLGILFPGIKNKLHYVLVIILLITWIPLISAYLKRKNRGLKA